MPLLLPVCKMSFIKGRQKVIRNFALTGPRLLNWDIRNVALIKIVSRRDLIFTFKNLIHVWYIGFY